MAGDVGQNDADRPIVAAPIGVLAGYDKAGRNLDVAGDGDEADRRHQFGVLAERHEIERRPGRDSSQGEIKGVLAAESRGDVGAEPAGHGQARGDAVRLGGTLPLRYDEAGHAFGWFARRFQSGCGQAHRVGDSGVVHAGRAGEKHGARQGAVLPGVGARRRIAIAILHRPGHLGQRFTARDGLRRIGKKVRRRVEYQGRGLDGVERQGVSPRAERHPAARRHRPLLDEMVQLVDEGLGVLGRVEKAERPAPRGQPSRPAVRTGAQKGIERPIRG